MNSEACPARGVHPDAYVLGGGYIAEHYIPDECQVCIERALAGAALTSLETDTYDEGVKALRESVSYEIDPDDAAAWRYYALKEPDATALRVVDEDTGFDIGDVSGASKSRTFRRIVTFACENE